MTIQDDTITLLTDQTLDVNLDLHPYKLVPGYEGELGLPIEAFLSLFAVKDGQPVAYIRTPEDLSRFVNAVRDEGQALAFVQLFTAPETYYLFQKGKGTLIDLSPVPDTLSPRAGTIAFSLARTLGILPPLVKQEGEAFHIVRYLVQADSLSAPRTVLRRSERVSEQGNYTLLKEEIIGELPADAVKLPYEE